VYRLDERLFRARVPPGSYLVGQPLARSTFRENYNLNVVALERNNQVTLAPPPDMVFQVGDIVTLEGILEDFRAKDVEPYLEILPARDFQERDLESVDVVVVETVLAPRSNLIGKTLKEVNFREKFGFMALAIWRAGRPIRRGMAAIELQFGDALLLQGPRARLRVLRAEPDLIVFSQELEPHEVARPGKIWIATLTMGGALFVAATGLMPTAEAVLAGSLLMVLANCLTADEAYAAVEWKAVFLVAGMLPMGAALTKTGIAPLVASGLVQWIGPYGPQALLAGLFLLAMLLTQVISGPAVAAMVGPLAIESALQLGVDPRALAMGVALATSMAFLTPLGHAVNVLVMGPGGYKFSDYFKVGLPLSILITAVVLIVLPIFWPL
jgi:di/tricarboxylate transporter